MSDIQASAIEQKQTGTLKILMVDDEEMFREEIVAELRENGYECETAFDGEQGLELAASFLPDVVLCDLMMPRMNGDEVLKKLSEQMPATQVIMITAYGTLEGAVDSFRKGACDYLLKPVIIEDLLAKIGRIRNERQLRTEVQQLRQIVSDKRFEIVGESNAIQEVVSLIEAFAEVDTSVLIYGETGTGKELVAQTIHERSARRSGRFVAVNCAAIPDTLMESEFFGYLRGAFSGAEQDRKGFIQAANGGTLFLDEISELPVGLQAKLLRALESREVTPLGSNFPQKTDLRLIAATNRDLVEEIKEGRFREDLYYRIRVGEMRLTSLTEMKEDIPLLTQHFIDQFNQQMRRAVRGADNRALRALMLYPWPGNVRELRNAIERAMVFRKIDFLELEDLPREIWQDAETEPIPDDLKQAVRAYEKAHIRAVIKSVDGNREAAAKRLGVDRSTLYRKLEG
ncbi:MAG: sigma-54 dependent transcriptional regulator [Planctomycetota bacterium]|nr:sigma-54 dependent transcriptional regulator [Planctomycetota bacterium]